jgi:segregation and condensation protein A
METTETLSYKVKTAVFEGPLELLLSLIESRKLFINEISLAQVTEDYISYIRTLNERSISDITGFIGIAATLILIKSRSLLPGIALTQDEEKSIVDLESRLRMYQVIKEVSEDMRRVYGKNIIFTAPDKRTMSFEDLFVPDERISTQTMLTCAYDVINALPKKEAPLPSVEIKKVFSIEEMIDSLTSRITSAMKMSFKDFAESHSGDAETHKEKKVYVIVSFLAMLELVRQGLVDVVQHSAFDDMEIVKYEEITIERVDDSEDELTDRPS